MQIKQPFSFSRVTLILLQILGKKVLTFLAFLFRFTLRPSRNKSLTILLKDNLNVTSFYIIKIKVAIIKFVLIEKAPLHGNNRAGCSIHSHLHACVGVAEINVLII